MTNLSIENTIDALHAVTDRAEREASRIGYFSALYARVTTAVSRNLRAGFFEDQGRMERLDVAFAKLYLDEVNRHLRGEEPSSLAWKVAFRVSNNPDLTILQHIYLGMIAHVLVDLPLGAARTCPGAAIHDLKNDFYKINDVVQSEMNAFHEDLRAVSPALQRWDPTVWELMSQGALFTGRRIAFGQARTFALANSQKRASLVARNDRTAAWLGQRVILGQGARTALRHIRVRECEDVREVIRALRGTSVATDWRPTLSDSMDSPPN